MAVKKLFTEKKPCNGTVDGFFIFPRRNSKIFFLYRTDGAQPARNGFTGFVECSLMWQARRVYVHTRSLLGFYPKPRTAKTPFSCKKGNCKNRNFLSCFKPTTSCCLHRSRCFAEKRFRNENSRGVWGEFPTNKQVCAISKVAHFDISRHCLQYGKTSERRG